MSVQPKASSGIFAPKTSEPSKWFVLYVHGRKEKIANDLLNQAGYRTYLPLEKKLKETKNRKRWVEEPLFKSYIFVKIKKYQLYDVLQSTYVTTYVKFQGEPATVREEDLLFIKRMLITQTSFEIVSGQMEVGKEVTLKTGPFKGFKGNVAEIRGKNSIVVQLTQLNSNVVISLKDIEEVKKQMTE
ncbi:MAG: UpxY family transcription antiterminator [Bacteroidales bacterium]|nr:UpxY family transcription antiterminator [Bacteroidales bacterium]